MPTNKLVLIVSYKTERDYLKMYTTNNFLTSKYSISKMNSILSNAGFSILQLPHYLESEKIQTKEDEQKINFQAAIFLDMTQNLIPNNAMRNTR